MHGVAKCRVVAILIYTASAHGGHNGIASYFRVKVTLLRDNIKSCTAQSGVEKKGLVVLLKIILTGQSVLNQISTISLANWENIN